jgi:hypothetical protein
MNEVESHNGSNDGSVELRAIQLEMAQRLKRKSGEKM